MPRKIFPVALVILLAAVTAPAWAQQKVRINWTAVTGAQSGMHMAQQEGVFKKKLDRAKGHGGGRASDVFLMVEIEEVLAQFLIGDLVG